MEDTAMSFTQDGTGGYLSLLLAGFLANECWRWLGVAVGGRLDLGGQPFLWVRAVALALVAGLVSRMVLFPAGALANVPMAIRLGAFAGGIALYLVLRRNLAAGVVGGAVLLMVAQTLLQ
jgi:branched-subunit amino acid transport protein AzlD